MDLPLHFLPATRLLELYASRELSPVDATKAALTAIERHNPRFNAFCVVDHDCALNYARQSEARWNRGEPLGPLDGVPTTVKDLILARGWPTLRGSRTIDPTQPWDVDAPVVARLKEAGAVLLGKTKSPREAMFWDWPSAYQAARVGQFKWVSSVPRDKRGLVEAKEELFDLAKDPSEKHDVMAEKPDVAAAVKARFAQWRAEMDAAEPRGPFRNY